MVEKLFFVKGRYFCRGMYFRKPENTFSEGNLFFFQRNLFLVFGEKRISEGERIFGGEQQLNDDVQVTSGLPIVQYSYSMVAKPIKRLIFHSPIIQFLTIEDIPSFLLIFPCSSKPWEALKKGIQRNAIKVQLKKTNCLMNNETYLLKNVTT